MNLLYPRKEGARFDWAYYTGTHVPLVRRKLGAALKAMSSEQGIAGGAPESPAAFVAIVNLTFESMAAFQAAFKAHAQELMADIPNYTSIEPIVQISEVKMGS
jgi:uncharacterized protein (TIGR02118 family)